MDYLRFARQWRAGLAGSPATSVRAAEDAPARPQPSLSDYSEPTESRAELTGTRKTDPESTEEILPQKSPPAETPAASGTGGEPQRRSVNPGEVLAGRYLVIEQVDHRGMGLIYKALDRHREKAGSPMPWVALKFATRSGAATGSTSANLRHEFLKLSKLAHPNIVSVYDFDADDGLDFVVMEWLEGDTLASLLTNVTGNRVALDIAEDIVCGLARALAHSHGLGIVHGDVKPSNVYLLRDRSVKLLDFGSSDGVPEDNAGESNWATRAYASCEVLTGDSPRPRDDVYALGVTAYCLLSGCRPFGELDATGARERRIVPEPLPADANRYWPAIETALRFDAVERPADAGEFLRSFMNPPTAQEVTTERNPLMQIAYGAIAVALLVALVAWAAGSIREPEDGLRTALDSAAAAFDDGRLTEPAGASAFTHFSTALALAPQNAEALNGLSDIAEEFLRRAGSALAAGDPELAVRYLNTAQEVAPGHFGISMTQDLIAGYGQNLLDNARRVAASDIGRAEQMVAQAETLLPAGDASVAGLRDELSRQKIDNELAALLQGVDERILSERITLPRGNSAVDLLRQARNLAPNDRQVLLAADRIASALLFQSMFAVSNGNLDGAQTFIDAAKALNVRHIALARAEYELARARNAALQTSETGNR